MKILNGYEHQDKIEDALDAGLVVASVLLGVTCGVLSSALHSLTAVSFETMDNKLTQLKKEESSGSLAFKDKMPVDQLKLAWDIVRNSWLSRRETKPETTPGDVQEPAFSSEKQADIASAKPPPSSTDE